MTENPTRVTETQADTSFQVREIDSPAAGVNYPTWELHYGLVLDDRLAMRYVAAARVLKLGFFQFQNGQFVLREKVEDFRYSRNHELVFPDGWKIEIRGFFRPGGLFVCLGSINDKFVRTPEEVGIRLPEIWETKRY